MTTEKNTLKTTLIFDDDGKSKLKLSIEWDKNKKKACVIMLCFGKGNGIYFDKSTSQCIKNLLSLDYGSVDIVNLFSSSDMHMNGSKETIDCVALFFIVLGEVLFFGTLTYINRLTAISKISVTSIAGVYMFINIVFSALLKGAFKDNILTFSILHIIFICLAAVAILLLSGVLKSINKDEKI